MSAIGTTPLVVRELQLNYLWPQYSLPWNNFFGRVQPNPFYLQNQLRNITIREVQSPLSFTSRPVVDSGNGYIYSTITVPKWSEINSFTSTEQTSSALKVFVGPYVDVAKDIAGLEYQYDYTGQLIWTSPSAVGNYVYLALNLNKLNPATINFPAYVQPANLMSTSADTCFVGKDAGNYSTLSGFININTNGSGCTNSNTIQLCLDNAVPFGPCSTSCSPTVLGNATTFYYVALALLAAGMVCLHRLSHSRFGRAMVAIRENETRMEAIGFPVFRYKLVCFVIAGAARGLAGALLASHGKYVNPNVLHWTQSGTLLVMVILGGVGRLWGGALGAAALLGLEELLANYKLEWLAALAPNYQQHAQLGVGVVLLAIVLFAPHGIAGMLSRRSRG